MHRSVTQSGLWARGAPWGRLPADGSVAPASPTNSSSLSSPSAQSETVDRSPRAGETRSPTSAPRERTSGSTRDAASPVAGSTVIVVPRASLLWKPQPPLRYSSVVRDGVRISDAFGLTIPAVRSPEFSSRSLRTSNA